MFSQIFKRVKINLQREYTQTDIKIIIDFVQIKDTSEKILRINIENPLPANNANNTYTDHKTCFGTISGQIKLNKHLLANF